MPVFGSLGIAHDADERRIARLRLNRPDRLNASGRVARQRQAARALITELERRLGEEKKAR